MNSHDRPRPGVTQRVKEEMETNTFLKCLVQFQPDGATIKTKNK